MHFVLVHGAWHGAWCFDRLVPELEAYSARVTVLDLPGHGDDPTPRDTVDLQAYVQRVESALRELDQRVELVGHSFAGAIIGRVAERMPQYLTGLTYLCAFLPRDGECVAALGREDPDTRLNAALEPGSEPGTIVLAPGQARRIFYQDCPLADAETAIGKLGPQPVRPLHDPVQLSAGDWGSVPRAYVLCRDDRAVSPAMQQLMLQRVPCDPVVEMHCGHSPFYARPAELADHLVGIASARSAAPSLPD